MSPEEMLEICNEQGREGLVKILCVFDSNPNINLIMEEIIDYSILTFSEEMSTSVFSDVMEKLNKRLYNEICDAALDKFNDGGIGVEKMTNELNELKRLSDN